MSRNRITQIVQEAAQNQGLNFYAGFRYKLQTESLLFPTLWLEPLILSGQKGRHTGEISYKVTCHLLSLNRQCSTAQKQALWESMEQQALAIYREIEEQPEILSVSAITSSPSEHDLTNYGEISLSVNFVIVCRFNPL